MDQNDCIFSKLARAQNNALIYFRSKLEPFNVTPAQYSVLKCLWDGGDQFPTQISKIVSLDSSTVTGILARLESKGLIERIQSHVDRRAFLIRITQSGLDLKEGIERIVDESNEEILACFDAIGVTQFKNELDHIIEFNATLISNAEQI